MNTNIFLWLVQKLFPDGRAFRMPENGIMWRLYRAISPTFIRLYNAVKNIGDVQLPDNANFTIDDAHAWYRRLGIYDSGLVSLADMKMHITQRLSFPGTPLDMQSLQFIQDQLQAAGFNVFLYKNKFPDGGLGWVTKSPAEVLGAAFPIAVHGFIKHGVAQHGQLASRPTKIVQYIEESKDATFNIGANYRATFYIAGATINTFANVDINRKIEFRQLVIKLKALQMCAFAFVNYV